MPPLSNSERQARHRQRQAYELALIMKQVSELGAWVNELQEHTGLEVRQLPEPSSSTDEQAAERPRAEIVNREAANTVVQLHRGVIAALETLLNEGDAEKAAAMLRDIDDRFSKFRRDAMLISRK